MRTRTNNIGNGRPSHITNPAPNTIAICIAMGFIFNFLKIRVSVVRFRPWPPSNLGPNWRHGLQIIPET